jgi:hypothetical protein
MAYNQIEGLALQPIFQTEIYAILQCARENIRRAYKHKWILVFPDSQAALKALRSPKVTSGPAAECLDALSALASLNEVTLMWVPGHCVIPGNEEVDKLARQASAMMLLDPEPALGISSCSARETRTGLSINIILPGKIYQLIDTANFLLADHVTAELETCLN